MSKSINSVQFTVMEKEIMSVLDNAVEMSVALGKGIYSVGQDVALGFERTGEGLGLGEDGRVAQIGFENNAMVALLSDFVKYGINNRNSPLFKTIVHILEHYYISLTDEELQAVAKQAGLAASYTLGRMVLGKKLAEAIAIRIAISIAASATYKAIAKRVGVSAGVSSTGIGAPIGLLMLQGVLQRSSLAATRLKNKSPELFRTLQSNGNLQLLYFILEKPMEKYIDVISKSPHKR